MKILWIAAEAFPFAKAGGLGDVSNGLPKALKKAGFDVRVLIPKYDWINPDKHSLKLISKEASFRKSDSFSIWQGFLPKSDVPIYFLEASVFSGAGIYEGDEVKKFLFLSEAALLLPNIVGWDADVFHANDWHTATVPVFARASSMHSETIARKKFILTIHNMAFQGSIPLIEYERRGIDKSAIEKFADTADSVRALRLGIHFSDKVTTVSPTYAREIVETEWGFGLQQDLKSKGKNFVGILNGIDSEEWDPSTDPNLVANYSVNNMEGKSECKVALQQEAELPIDSSAFLIGLVARMTSQKGFDILIDSLPLLFEENIQMVVLGTGERDIEASLLKIQQEWEDKLGVFLKYDEGLSRKIYAGTDAFLIPSLFEPCGLTQMYAMRYGSVPIAHRVGGLADTVFEDKEKQTGFVFEEYSSEDLYSAVCRALERYLENPDSWIGLVKKIMQVDNSWESRVPYWKNLLHDLIQK